MSGVRETWWGMSEQRENERGHLMLKVSRRRDAGRPRTRTGDPKSSDHVE